MTEAPQTQQQEGARVWNSLPARRGSTLWHSAWSKSRNTRRSDGVRTGSSIARTNLASPTGRQAVAGDREAIRDKTRQYRPEKIYSVTDDQSVA